MALAGLEVRTQGFRHKLYDLRGREIYLGSFLLQEIVLSLDVPLTQPPAQAQKSGRGFLGFPLGGCSCWGGLGHGFSHWNQSEELHLLGFLILFQFQLLLGGEVLVVELHVARWSLLELLLPHHSPAEEGTWLAEIPTPADGIRRPGRRGYVPGFLGGAAGASAGLLVLGLAI